MKARPTQSRKGVKGGTSSLFVCPLQSPEAAPLVGSGAKPRTKDLLSSPEIENILENSDFICLLNQASGDRKILAERLNISPQQLRYVDNSEPGEGLLIYENVILPFKNPIPKNTQLYQIMTTRLGEGATV